MADVLFDLEEMLYDQVANVDKSSNGDAKFHGKKACAQLEALKMTLERFYSCREGYVVGPRERLEAKR
jgi:hypothetical protein